MSRIFSALANAASKYGEGRFKRKIYDDQQAQQSLENKRRAFEFAATQGRLTEQMNLLKQQRDDQLQRQREADVVGAQLKGYEDAPIESVGSGVNAYLQSQGMGGPATAQAPRAAQTAPFKQQVEDRTFEAGAQGTPRYATVGGRVMKYDPQREANNEQRAAMDKYVTDLTFKRDVARDNQASRDEAAAQRADEENNTRLMIAQIAASAKQGAGSGAQGVNAPASEKFVSDMATLRDIADQAKYAASLLQKAGGVAGPGNLVGRTMRKFTGQSPTQGDITAAEAQRVMADLRKKLFGAAQSMRELRSASEFLPQLESSNDAFVLAALEGIGRSAGEAARRRYEAARAGGRPTGNLGEYVDEFGDTQSRTQPGEKPRVTPVKPTTGPVPWEIKKP